MEHRPARVPQAATGPIERDGRARMRVQLGRAVDLPLKPEGVGVMVVARAQPGDARPDAPVMAARAGHPVLRAGQRRPVPGTQDFRPHRFDSLP